MHRLADTVPDQRPDDAEPGRVDNGLDGVRHVSEPTTDPALLDRRFERRSCGLQQVLRPIVDVADGHGQRRVGHVSIERDADVEAYDIALDDRVLAGNSVHDHVVRRGADRGGKTAVAQERRHAAVTANVLLGSIIERLGRDTRSNGIGEHLEATGKHASSGGNLGDLFLGLADDHVDVPPASTRRTSAKTSSGIRPPPETVLRSPRSP